MNFTPEALPEALAGAMPGGAVQAQTAQTQVGALD
jgi:hypothetical protein